MDCKGDKCIELTKQVEELKKYVDELKAENEAIKDGFTKEEACKFLEANHRLKEENEQLRDELIEQRRSDRLGGSLTSP